MMKVGLIDYGAGNIFSILCGLRRAGIKAKIYNKPSDIALIDAVVIPGVGNFSQAAKFLQEYKLALEDLHKEGRYILGICLGMQILLEKSEEGEGKGLGLIKGEVKRLPNSVKVPHMGWNTIKVRKETPLFDDLPINPHFYFVHSFASLPVESTDIVATTEYGGEFASAVQKETILGLQFHPEKSGEHGATVLSNFREMIGR